MACPLLTFFCTAPLAPLAAAVAIAEQLVELKYPVVLRAPELVIQLFALPLHGDGRNCSDFRNCSCYRLLRLLLKSVAVQQWMVSVRNSVIMNEYHFSYDPFPFSLIHCTLDIIRGIHFIRQALHCVQEPISLDTAGKQAHFPFLRFSGRRRPSPPFFAVIYVLLAISSISRCQGT